MIEQNSYYSNWPELTAEQKARFEKGVSEIMAQTPKEVQIQWDGQVNWWPSTKPLLDDVILQTLSGQLLDQLNELILALGNRTI